MSAEEIRKILLETGYYKTDWKEIGNLNVLKSQNLATILHTTREVKDSENVTINFQYQFGSNTDPKGKSGLAHLTEHLWFETEFSRMLDLSNIGKDAWTSSKYLAMTASGTWNYAHDYSLVRSLPQIIERFYNHNNFSDQDKLEIEKQVILREISDSQNSFYHVAIWEIMLKEMFPNHEMCIDILGDSVSLNSITLNDVRDYVMEYFTPSNSIIAVYCEGGSNKSDTLIPNLVEKIDKYDKKAQVSLHSDYDSNLINFRQGQIDDRNLGDRFKNKVLIIYNYILDISVGSLVQLTVDGYVDRILQDELWIEIRKNALAYSSSSQFTRINSEKVLLTISLLTDHGAHKEIRSKLDPLLPDFFQKIIIGKKREYIMESILNECLRQSAVPILLGDILRSNQTSFQDYQLFVNLPDRRAKIIAISYDDIISVFKLISNVKPHVYVIGDL